MTGKIFLNYRRLDAGWADPIYERLVKRLPRESVFMDVAGDIPLGFSWAKWIDKNVAECDLMLVLIGPIWVKEFAERVGDDYVKIEIESALARQIPVVPVFLPDATIPERAQLPESVRPLLDLEAARLQRRSFGEDVEALLNNAIRSIELSRKRDDEKSQVLSPAPTAARIALPPEPTTTPAPRRRKEAEPLRDMQSAIDASKDQPRATLDIHWMLMGQVVNQLKHIEDGRELGKALDMGYKSKAYTKDVLDQMWRCMILADLILDVEARLRFTEDQVRNAEENRREIKEQIEIAMTRLS